MQFVLDTHIALHILVSSGKMEEADKALYVGLSQWLGSSARVLMEARPSQESMRPLNDTLRARFHENKQAISALAPDARDRRKTARSVRDFGGHYLERVRDPDARRLKGRSLLDAVNAATKDKSFKMPDADTLAFTERRKENLRKYLNPLYGEVPEIMRTTEQANAIEAIWMLDIISTSSTFETFIATFILIASLSVDLPSKAKERALFVYGRELSYVSSDADFTSSLKTVEEDETARSQEVIDQALSLNRDVENCYRELDQESDKLARLESIRAHPDGASCATSWIKRQAALLYVVGALTVSVLVAALNFSNRDNAFERVADFAQTATLLLVSVFGLVKLKSEDDNAIRNTLLGNKVMRSGSDIMKHLDMSEEEELKCLIARSTEPMPWLDPVGACYAVHGASGSIRLSEGISMKTLYESGWRFNNNRLFQIQSGHSFFTDDDDRGWAHIRISDRKLTYPDFCVPFREPMIVAGEYKQGVHTALDIGDAINDGGTAVRGKISKHFQCTYVNIHEGVI